jgi:hypothetical protein
MIARWSWLCVPPGAAAFVGGMVLGISTILGTWIIHDSYRDAVPMAAQGIGTCHRFATVEEYYNVSDLRLPVPCTQPHQTETFSVSTLTGPLAERPERPGLEALNAAKSELCQDGAIRRYLGAAARDEYAFLQIVIRFPAPGEWRDGARGYRCELMSTTPVNGGPPVLSEPLGNAFARAYGDRFRRCAEGDRLVPCAERHDAEFVNAWLPVPSGVDRDNWAAGACAPYVGEYLGGPLPDRYRAAARPAPGGAACLLTSADGGSWTGSRAAQGVAR